MKSAGVAPLPFHRLWRTILSATVGSHVTLSSESFLLSSPDISNITCVDFLAMPEAEQRAFVIGVANGRGMTAGLFEAYSRAAQRFAANETERASIAASFETIYSMAQPLLEIDAASLLNGIRAACSRPEFRQEFVINALASVHLEAAKALKAAS